MALTQIVTTDSVSASVVNTKIVDPANTAISGLQIAQTAGGTATAITLTGIELTNGYQKTFITGASNSGSATTVNGKPLYKPGGTSAPNLIAGKASSIWYNLAGDCFFYKASAEGTAVAGDVLASKTFSNDDDTGISGTLSLTGNSVAGDVLATKTFYNTNAKTKATGTMVNRGAVTITPSTTNQTILTGYHNGSGVVNAIPNTYRKWASGVKNHPDGASVFTVTGLTFTPKTVILMGESTYYSNTWHSIVVSSEYQDYMDTANSWYHGVTYQNGGNGTITMPFNVVTFNADGFTISSGNLPNYANYQWVALG